MRREEALLQRLRAGERANQSRDVGLDAIEGERTLERANHGWQRVGVEDTLLQRSQIWKQCGACAVCGPQPELLGFAENEVFELAGGAGGMTRPAGSP